MQRVGSAWGQELAWMGDVTLRFVCGRVDESYPKTQNGRCDVLLKRNQFSS